MGNILVTVASWEERFRLGTVEIIPSKNIDRAIIYYYKEFYNRTKIVIEKIRDYCQICNVSTTIVPLDYSDPKEAWLAIYKSVEDNVFKNDDITLDISTMPRETIWTLLNLLVSKSDNISYNYSAPEKYNETWLSRDPYEPRYVYKLSGIARLGKEIVLILITGYDSDRIRQFINYYEPIRCYLGLQSGDQFGNKNKNQEKYIEEFVNRPGVELFPVNSYDMKNGYHNLRSIIEANTKEYDIVMSSLGPKMSALALFYLHKKFKHTALAYGPSRYFNRDYSSGLSVRYKGDYRDICF